MYILLGITYEKKNMVYLRPSETVTSLANKSNPFHEIREMLQT